jgi:hypothetical protein
VVTHSAEETELGFHGPGCDFDARGPLTFRCPPEVGDLTGLALLCTRTHCASRFARFVGHLERAGRPSIPFELSIDIDSAYVLVAEYDGDGPPPSDADKACVAGAAAWLSQNLSGPMLETLHERLLQAKDKHLDRDMWKRADWSWWTPGTVVAWSEVEPDGRRDLYVVGERCFTALDYYCANPECPCIDVQIVFLTSERKKLGAVTLAVPDGRRTLVAELAPGVSEDEVAHLADLFLRRHGAERLAARRTRIHEEVGVALYAGTVGDARAPASAAPSRKVGRNEACPCGSGKKFKKCCGK